MELNAWSAKTCVCIKHRIKRIALTFSYKASWICRIFLNSSFQLQEKWTYHTFPAFLTLKCLM